ncbi:DUF4226 domain-containing protein [Mycolicibacterium moriokaense]|uniref:Uncharacterized protein DUF4226 n=1 Tax=Mycolicibacterium moriokaense TaxID=39691 RepID=A0A318H8T9_9MYCO|nr:DUF4226 domain-containing protein [Mycolicibacterium moriokaense]PXX01542.1 uncharacterized protein DUF4226 [Mycolicibacterium moriokaense]
MTQAAKFDEQTHWERDPGGLRFAGEGWAPPGADFFINRADPYWGHVLDKARRAYGDPNMHFSTDSVEQQRQLVFGDGTAVPRDGSLAYRDAANNKTFLLNSDGTVSLLGANGPVGQPVSPAGFRRTPDGSYAPVDSTGQQVAPLTGAPPPTPNGYHDQGGLLTPKNERGEYYVDDPATGKRTYFDAGGRPIADPSAAAPAGSALPTDEQQSGRAADAVRKLHEELQNRYSQISDAEGKLSEVLLTAHATTADGQQKLQPIQQKIVAAINNPDLSLDTPAGEQAFLTFLRGQVAAIGDVVTSGTLSSEDQAKAVEALSNLYGNDTSSTPTPVEEPAASAAPAAAPADAALGPEEAMPDPTLSDLGLGGVGAPQASDPLSALASALPAAMGAFPPGGLGGGFGGDPFSSLAGAAAPLAGLASQLGEQPRRDDTGDNNIDKASGDGPDVRKGSEPEHQPPQGDSATTPPPAAPVPTGTPGDGAPPAAPAATPAAVPMTAVSLPDGSTATARTAALAEAVKSYLGGTPVDAAYRQAGIDLPPPGTPVTNPVDPSALSVGAIGMFKDHYVVALSPVKALQDGQVVPLATVAAGPDFLGWMDPAAAPTPTPVGAPTT